MNGPAGLRGLVALALALAIPPCASGATNLCGGTALGPLDAAGSEVLSIALAPIAGGQELQPPWELASTGSTALTPTTLRQGIGSGAAPPPHHHAPPPPRPPPPPRHPPPPHPHHPPPHPPHHHPHHPPPHAHPPRHHPHPHHHDLHAARHHAHPRHHDAHRPRHHAHPA